MEWHDALILTILCGMWADNCSVKWFKTVLYVNGIYFGIATMFLVFR